MNDVVEQRNARARDIGWLYHYEFKGRVPFAFDDVVAWCRLTFPGPGGTRFTYAGVCWWFKRKGDYTMFLLRWS